MMQLEGQKWYNHFGKLLSKSSKAEWVHAFDSPK